MFIKLNIFNAEAKNYTKSIISTDVCQLYLTKIEHMKICNKFYLKMHNSNICFKPENVFCFFIIFLLFCVRRKIVLCFCHSNWAHELFIIKTVNITYYYCWPTKTNSMSIIHYTNSFTESSILLSAFDRMQFIFIEFIKIIEKLQLL